MAGKKLKNKKKISRRSRTKYPALRPELNLKTRYELIDYDYLDKLSDKEKAWLNKFTEEYTNVVLDRDNLRKNLHRTKRLKKDCDDRNNARNRCIWTKAKASGKAMNLSDLEEDELVVDDFENLLINLIDLKNGKKD